MKGYAALDIPMDHHVRKTLSQGDTTAFRSVIAIFSDICKDFGSNEKPSRHDPSPNSGFSVLQMTRLEVGDAENYSQSMAF
jgi:hypothetical protein